MGSDSFWFLPRYGDTPYAVRGLNILRRFAQHAVGRLVRFLVAVVVVEDRLTPVFRVAQRFRISYMKQKGSAADGASFPTSSRLGDFTQPKFRGCEPPRTGSFPASDNTPK